MPARWSAILDEVFAQRDLAEWRAILHAAGVTFGIVGTVEEAFTDRQMRDCGALVPFADGAQETVSAPFHIDGVDKIPPHRAPALGEHSADLLQWPATRPPISTTCVAWAWWPDWSLLRRG